MPRIPLPGPEEMTPAQRRVHDAIISGPRGTLIGPLRAAIHNPELAERWSALGEILRFRTSLPKRLSELAILVTGRRWTSQVEWWVHARAAADAGLDARAARDLRLVAVRLELRAEIRGAPVLPHDRGGDRTAGGPVP